MSKYEDDDLPTSPGKDAENKAKARLDTMEEALEEHWQAIEANKSDIKQLKGRMDRP